VYKQTPGREERNREAKGIHYRVIEKEGTPHAKANTGQTAQFVQVTTKII
jgi:hypothetical protein